MPKRSSKAVRNTTAFSIVREEARTSDADTDRANAKAEAEDLKHQEADAKANSKQSPLIARGKLGALGSRAKTPEQKVPTRRRSTNVKAAARTRSANK